MEVYTVVITKLWRSEGGPGEGLRESNEQGWKIKKGKHSCNKRQIKKAREKR